MDGLPAALVSETTAWCQQTLKAPIGCVGVGLHTGSRVSMTFRPAPADHGIVFRRTDLGSDIPARFDRVADTRLSTVLADGTARIGTVEHVMAALAGCGIDNALVEVDGPEPPILDGSAAPFVFLLDCAGTLEQDTARTRIEIHRTVRVQDGDAFAELRRPGRDKPGHGAVDRLRRCRDRAPGTVAAPDAGDLPPRAPRARTFALAEEIDQLRAAGLAQGGSLDNAVVVDQARVLNPTGLRMPDEFARHKLLDAVGDMALAGAPLVGRFIAHCSGHTLNNRLLRALFADRLAWREVSALPLSVAAA